MADIELVVKIDEKNYEHIKRLDAFWSEKGLSIMTQALLKGTPLSKGHGKLIDADKLNECIVDRITMPYVPINKIQDAPPIIEADKENEK